MSCDLRYAICDFAINELVQAADKPTITGDAVNHYLKYARGKRAVVFCCSIEHSKHVVAQFGASGIPSSHVDGKTETTERDQAVRNFESGKILILSNVELFGEGFDLPAIEAAILLRPTQSLGLYLQQCGRALRPSPGKKEALILDHAGNCQRHGLPDEQRFWSLDGRKMRNKQAVENVSVKVCPQCFAAQFSGKPVCSNCGYKFPVESREVDQVEGELVEIDPNTMRIIRKREQGLCNNFEDLVALGRQRGYRRPEMWAKYVFQARQAKKLAGVA